MRREATQLVAIIAILAVNCVEAATKKLGETWPDNRGQHIQAHGGGNERMGWKIP